MHRRFVLFAVVTLVAALVGLAAPAGAGNGGPTVELVKEAEGSVPVGAEFEIELDCEQSGVTTVTFFDGESTILPFEFGEVCTVTETDDQGAATVTYQCSDEDGVECLDDNQFEALLDGVQDPFVRLTVTNTFDPAPTTTTTTLATTTTAAVAPVAAAVVSTPAFTG